MTTPTPRHSWIAPLLVGVLAIACLIDARNQVRELAAKAVQLIVPLVTEPPRTQPVCLAQGDLDLDVRQVWDRSYEIDRTTLESLLGDLGRLSRTARIVPEITDGRASGFRLYSVRPDSFWERLGFRNGDLVLSINGLDIRSPENALEIYAKLKTADAFVVTLERQGELITNSYRIR